jgi:hypothetical protein
VVLLNHTHDLTKPRLEIVDGFLHLGDFSFESDVGFYILLSRATGEKNNC